MNITKKTYINENLLRLPAVRQRTGLSRSSIYAAIKSDQFPKSINLGARSVAWIESEIDQWIQNRILNRKT